MNNQNTQRSTPLHSGNIPPMNMWSNRPPMPPNLNRPMSRRARLSNRLMSGAKAFSNSLPNWFATYAVGAYAVALLGVNLVNSNFATEWYFWLFGFMWVGGFFFLCVRYSHVWSINHMHGTKAFEKKLFWTGLLIRIAYVFLSYWFYNEMTGMPYEYSKADSIGYVETATGFASYWEHGTLFVELKMYAEAFLSDMGYPLFLMPIVRVVEGTEVNLLIRIVHAILGAYTAVLIYRIAARSMDANTARLAAIFCMLHPVLICYCGITLKETLMTFLLVLFIDMASRMIEGRKYTFAAIAPMIIVGLSLFLFRTVLGVIAFMALFFALVMLDTKVVSLGKKIALGTMVAGILFMSLSENIMREVRQITEIDVRGQQQTSLTRRYGEGKQGGNVFAKYAGAAVFAPLIFTIPFPTMVATYGQEDMRLIHGGNWMRNVMSGFVILAMFMLLLSGDWRKYTLPLAMLLGYLLMLAFTQFAHSLRFHIPIMPFEMIFAAYAITSMRKKHKNWYLIWCLLCVVMCFGWNWFKLAGRGL